MLLTAVGRCFLSSALSARNPVFTGVMQVLGFSSSFAVTEIVGDARQNASSF